MEPSGDTEGNAQGDAEGGGLETAIEMLFPLYYSPFSIGFAWF